MFWLGEFNGLFHGVTQSQWIQRSGVHCEILRKAASENPKLSMPSDLLLWSCPVFPENSVSLPERIGEVKDFHKDPGSPSREVGLRFYFSVFRFSSNSPVFSLGSHHLLISLNQGAVWSVPPEYKATISYWTGEVYSSDFNDEGWEAEDLTILLGPFNKIPRIQPTLPLTNMVPDALFQNGYNIFQDEFPWVLLQPILKTPPFLPLCQLSFHLLNTY